jgi:hypothetical protein
MMNIDSVTAHLSKMSPQQLQQFASMHMDDPIMLAAAKFVSNQQTKMQQSQQPAPGTPPKVNEQTVASIAPQQMPQQQMPQQQMQPQAQQPQQQMPPQAQGLPEDSGIAQLPARNMQGMAEGGIVAFAGNDGSLVEDPQMSFGDIVQSLMSRGVDRPSATDLARKYITQPLREKMSEWANPAENQSPEETARLARSGMALPPAAPPINMTPAAPAAPYADTRRFDIATNRPAPAPRPPAPRPMAPAGGAPQATDAGPMSIAGLQKLQASLAPTGPVADPYATQHAEIAQLRETQGKAELADAQERKTGLAGLLAPREARIKEREARLQKTDDMNVNMSLINAGLAMMQSRKKDFSGIAEGLGIGVKQYSEGLKLSEAARQKIEDAKDAFDELKFNQANMSQKEITAAKGKIADGAIASKNETISGIEKATGVKQKAAEAVFTNYVNSREAALDRSSRERTAAFSAQVQKEIAAMPGANEKFYAALGGGDVRKGFDYMTAATAEGKGDEAIMQAVIKSPEILGSINPELRKIVEQRIADRFEKPKIVNVPAAGLKP